jgi:16S rRNA (cytidine1402-2'-O)-methyltransferase
MTASTSQNSGLYLISTPIGHLGDLSPRAREQLASVDLIAAEDTRHTGGLLRHFGIGTPLVSLHEHSGAARIEYLLAKLRAGARIALVSDAGTPLISDPGFELVAAAIAEHMRVIAIPGPCAAIAALSVSGLPTDRFVFEGFLPSRREARKNRLLQLRNEPRTLVFYEAPQRIEAALADSAAILGPERRAGVARELTKIHETTYRGSLAELAAQAAHDPDFRRGELVLVIAGAEPKAEIVPADAERVLAILLRELTPAQAAKLAARITGVPRGELYALATTLAREP